MRVLIAGMDGYLGWSLACHLGSLGHEVAGCDSFLRRKGVAEMGSHSVTPIRSMPERLDAFQSTFGTFPLFREGDLRDYAFVSKLVSDFQPEAVVHFGQMPSAPYSMIDVKHCNFTMENNIIGNLNLLFALREHAPSAHLVKLGTMGEYGTPNVDIPEGFFEVEYRGRKDRLPFPRQAGSWYHWTKVHDSHNVMFACKIWGLRATDIMQGVVFGTRIEAFQEKEALCTRFDIDQCFGTAINRFCAQAVIGHPLTLYGKGHQKRGFLPLQDSMQCLTIALLNPPADGEYRVFNQFEEVYDLTELAQKVKKVAEPMGIKVTIRNLQNPRKELEEHYYKPDHEHLLSLGYEPTRDLEREVELIITELRKHENRIRVVEKSLIPDIHWDGERKRCAYLSLEGAAEDLEASTSS